MSEPPPDATRPKSSRELLEEHLRQERAKVKAAVHGRGEKDRASTAALRVLESSGLTVADLARAERAVAKRRELDGVASAPMEAAARMPASVQVALGKEGAFNPKIHETDAKRFKRDEEFSLQLWQSALRGFAAAKRMTGDVLEATINQGGSFFAWVCRNGGLERNGVRPTKQDRARALQGNVELTFKELAGGVGRGCRVTTSVKLVRLLEDWGFINTFNTLKRDGRRLLRGPNNYVLVIPPDLPGEAEPAPAPEAAEPPPALKRLQRFNAWLARWGKAFSLRERPWGLNATPIAAHRFAHLPAEERPAPA